MSPIANPGPPPQVRFSVVTPVSNGERFIAQAIESVLSQRGDFSIDYVVADNCSTDGTAGIVERFAKSVSEGSYPKRCGALGMRHLRRRDRGMYDAINSGFEGASGTVYCWLNADDVYMEGAFATVSRAFAACPQVAWLKGITSYIDAQARITQLGEMLLYDRDWIAAGLYGTGAYFIQQDSVFWRAGLWKDAGGANARLRLAGDYDLWIRFARRERLYGLNAYLSCFRSVPGQLSADREAYLAEAAAVASPEPALRQRVRDYLNHEHEIPAWKRASRFRKEFGRLQFAYMQPALFGRLAMRASSYYRVPAPRRAPRLQAAAHAGRAPARVAELARP